MERHRTLERHRTHRNVPEFRGSIQTSLPDAFPELRGSQRLRAGTARRSSGTSQKANGVHESKLTPSIAKETPKPKKAREVDAASIETEEPDSNYYYRDVGTIPLLVERAAEVKLAKAMEVGRAAKKSLCVENGNLSSAESNRLRQITLRGDLARKKLIEANLRLVISLALRYTGRGRELEDLIQEGNIGLMNAVDKFDYHRGLKFSTYATRLIVQALYKTLHEDTRTIRITEHGIQILTEIDKIAGDLLQKGLEPTASNIAALLHRDSKEIEILMHVSKRLASLETPLGAEKNGNLGDTLTNKDNPEMDEAAANALLRENIDRTFTSLNPRERKVLELRFGLDGNGIRTLEETGNHLGVSKERARQIEAEALGKLRHPSRSKLLREYLE